MVGVLSQHMPLVRKLSLESVVFVDLDANTVVSTMDDASLLPKKITEALRQAVDEAVRNEAGRTCLPQHPFSSMAHHL